MITTIDLLVLLYIGVCLYRLTPCRPLFRSIRRDYLSADSGKSLRGILALGVVFHHLSQANLGGGLLPLFSKIGYLLVSVFFFLSGYGLMKQHMAREDYRRRFLRKRLPAILIPYLLATALYWLGYAAMGDPWTLRYMIREFCQGSPIVSASWYVVCIFLFYLAFWGLMWLCGRRFARMLPGAALFLVGYVLVCRKLGFGSWWYNTAPVLLLGMAWALYQSKIDEFLEKHIAKAIPVALAAFLGIYGGKILLNPYIPSPWVGLLLTWCVAALFVCCVILALAQVRVGNPLLNWVGECSLELYLCHFLVIQLLRSSVVYLHNDLLYGICILLGSLVLARGFHWIDRKLIGLCLPK